MKNGNKICPFCGEEIKETAKKCRFCGEILDGSIKQTKVIKSSGWKSLTMKVIMTICFLSSLLLILGAFDDSTCDLNFPIIHPCDDELIYMYIWIISWISSVILAVYLAKKSNKASLITLGILLIIGIISYFIKENSIHCNYSTGICNIGGINMTARCFFMSSVSIFLIILIFFVIRLIWKNNKNG